MSSAERSSAYDRLYAVVERHTNPVAAKSLLRTVLSRANLTETALNRAGLNAAILKEVERQISRQNIGRSREQDLLRDLNALNQNSTSVQRADSAILAPERVAILTENDIVVARRTARDLAAALGFPHTEQIKIATAVSELSRNAFTYAGSGALVLTTLTTPKRGLKIEVIDQGKGIPNIATILAGTYQSKTGMGLGLRGCQKLMHAFSIESSPESGTHIRMEIYL